jgi:hypothetical protein
MSARPIGAIAILAVLSVVATALPAGAQRPMPRGHPRIEVNPRPLVHRRCTSWYVVQHRPSGTVLFPEQHCWWERG